MSSDAAINLSVYTEQVNCFSREGLKGFKDENYVIILLEINFCSVFIFQKKSIVQIFFEVNLEINLNESVEQIFNLYH